MIGLAAKPGTDVEPMCSSSSTRSPSAARIRAATTANCAGQPSSYGTTSTGRDCPPMRTLATSSRSASSKGRQSG